MSEICCKKISPLLVLLACLLLCKYLFTADSRLRCLIGAASRVDFSYFKHLDESSSGKGKVGVTASEKTGHKASASGKEAGLWEELRNRHAYQVERGGANNRRILGCKLCGKTGIRSDCFKPHMLKTHPEHLKPAAEEDVDDGSITDFT